MTDIVTSAVRSRMMAGIRGTNTLPEVAVRRGLHRLGFRYSLHSSRLPGKPDIVLTRHKAVVLVHGCFWHGHGCHLFKWPGSRMHFWKTKITSNRMRDEKVMDQLREAGWRVLVIWECALKGKNRRPLDEVISKAVKWIRKGRRRYEIKGFAHACN
jgi:DNA mismatch endonuclease (patch repair protein)